MTTGSAGRIHLSVRRPLGKVWEETGELAFGNIPFGGLIMVLAAKGMGLIWLAGWESGDTLGKVGLKRFECQLALFKQGQTHTKHHHVE